MHPIDLALEDVSCYQTIGRTYLRLSGYDQIALAIAKTRHIPLVTGDGALRRAARAEGSRSSAPLRSSIGCGKAVTSIMRIIRIVCVRCSCIRSDGFRFGICAPVYPTAVW